MYLLYQDGTAEQVENLFMTDPYHASAGVEKDGLHRALISLVVAVEGR